MARTARRLQAPGPGHPHEAGRTGPAACGPGQGRSARTCGGAATTASPRCRRVNGELAGIAERVARQADAVVRNARRTLRRQGEQATGKAKALVEGLEQTAGRVRKVAAQTRQRLAGTTPDGSTRLVSLHDGDARPIAKGRLGRPVEFGYKAQLVDNEDGVIVDHNVEAGNPPDAPMLVPAIERVKARAGRAPRAVTADRGYGEAAVEDDLRAAGRPLRRRAPQGPTQRGPPPDREPTGVPQDGPLADRLRRPHQLRETRLRAEPHPHGRPRRRPNLVRARHLLRSKWLRGCAPAGASAPPRPGSGAGRAVADEQRPQDVVGLDAVTGSEHDALERGVHPLHRHSVSSASATSRPRSRLPPPTR